MKKLLFVLLLLPTTLSLKAQEEFIEPSRFITRVSFNHLLGGVILLNARFDSFPDTLNFILDTGSGGISLDSTTAVAFNLEATPSNKTIRGIGGIRKVSFLHDRKLHFDNLTINNLDFHLNDYDLLTSVYGERIDGIIGYSVLNRYILKINYDSTFIEFWTKGTLKYPKGGFFLKPYISTIPVHSFQIKDNRPINSRFLVDIGAGLNMMLTTDFIKDSALLQKKRKLYTKEAEGMGGKIDLSVTVIKEVKIGPYKFRNVPVEIFDDDYNVTSYPSLGGILGNDLLRRFNTIINYSQRTFHLVPNSHFNDAFDYSYSGISLYQIPEGIMIGDVSKDSPAEKVGLQEGDMVIAINKNFSQNLNAYKIALQTVNQYVKIIVLREHELKEFNFKIKSIY